MNLYTGVVENRDDPLKLGRCQVRIVGLHTEDKSVLATEDLPWAYPMQPVTSAAINGIGWTPVGPVLGTWVVVMFRDPDNQMPIMLGTIGGIPQSKSAELAKNQSGEDIIATDGGVLVDSQGSPVTTSDGTPIQAGTKEAQANPPADAPSSKDSEQPKLEDQKDKQNVDKSVLEQPIPTTPPPGSTSKPAEAERNIKLLIEACDAVGLTSKYAKCAILGISGGESAWLPVEEGYYYSSADALAKTFRRTFSSAEEAQAYTKWKGSREDFFRKIYSPEGNGQLLGHKDKDDGAKYFGRGFNQITGKSLYQQIQNFLKGKGITVDLMNNPRSIIDDPKTCALATAAFYSLNVKHPQNDPGYFVAARKRTGADANGTGYAKKQKYYEYFLGASVSASPTNKPAANDQNTYTKEQVKDLPPAKKDALLEDRSTDSGIGFKDPTGKYPLRELLNEPDTNRLARSVIKETAIEFKDFSRIKGIPTANGQGTWDQPVAPFGGKYPYNKVYETESGHVLAFDDTPGHENISLYHRQGTFIDVDSNGTQVNKIVGDGYVIIERNGAIYIGGQCNLTVGNGVNILVQGDADIQVEGESVINLKGNADIGVADNLNISVGGDLKIDAANISMKSSGDMDLLVSNSTRMTSSASFELGTAGNMRLDYSRGDFGDGANSASYYSTLKYPEKGSPINNQFQPLQTPVRPSPPVPANYALDQENLALTEDYIANPDKYNNPEAAKNGVKDNYPGTPKDGGQGQSLLSPGAGDIPEFLKKQLELTAASGHWRETGMGGKPSNKNITGIWSDLGFKGKVWETDQTAWCAGFMNWVLKQCGYRYVQDAAAYGIKNNPAKWSATKVDIADAQPGDIVVWNFSHVNFVYTAQNGKLSFCGGNQGGKARDNNPNSGDVTVSWPSGWTPDKGGITAIYRPSKT